MKNRDKFEMKNIDVRPATFSVLEHWWDKKIVLHPFDNAYKVWKKCFISENANGKRRTFFAFDDGRYVGQGTLLLYGDDEELTRGDRAEIIKLEIEEEYRNKGIATLIYKRIENHAKAVGIKYLTIGVEPCEIRNMQIYFHWGFTSFIKVDKETYPPKKVGEDGETITVLYYAKEV